MTKSKSKYIFIPLFLVVLILTLIISLIPKATNKVYASSADNVETVYNFYGSNFSSYIDCGNTAPVAVNFKITLTQSGSGFFCTPSLAFDNYLVSWSSNNAYQDSILNPKDSAFHTYTGFTYLNGIFMDNFKKPKVQVTEEDKQKSYYKYYERELAQIDPEKAGKIFGPPMNPVGQLAFVDRAKILEPGFEDEIPSTKGTLV